MKIASIGVANMSFGKLEKGIKEKCENEGRINRETNALDKLYLNGNGLRKIEEMDDFILKDAHQKDKYERPLYALEFIGNDTIKPKKPIYVGTMFDFFEGFTNGYGSQYIKFNEEMEDKINTVRKTMDILG